MERKRKGQVWSVDLVMATAVLVLILTYLSAAWAVQSDNLQGARLREQEQQAALSLADQLVRSRGSPENWTSAGPQPNSVGLASQPHVLDVNRINNFTALSYATAKNWTGLGEEFYLAIVNTSSNATLYSAGFNNATNVTYTVTRLALLGNTTVQVQVKIYENHN